MILMIAACNDQAKNQDKARVLYEEGLRLREEKRSEEAAECFLKALELLDGNDIWAHDDVRANHHSP